MKKKTDATGGGERLRSAMSLLNDRWIDEAEGGAAAAPRKKSGRGFRIAAIAAAAVLLLAAVPLGIFIYLSRSGPDPELPEYDVSRGLSVLPEALRGVTVTADGAKGRIIPTDTAFIVKTSGEISPEELASNLSITPQTDFSVTRLSTCEFRVAPATGKLNEGAIYRVAFGDPENPAISYAFQTDSQLMIRSFFPAAYSDGVPVDTAIVVSFSEALDDSACEQISLYPSVKGKAELISGGTAVVFLPDKELEPDTQYEIRVGDGIKSVSGRKLSQVSGATFRTAATKELAGSFLFDPVAQNWKTFSPGDDASIEISFQKGISVIPAKADAEIFRFKSTEDAYRAVIALESICGETTLPDSFGKDETVKICEISAEEEDSGNSSGRNGSITLDLGNSLEEGVYFGKARVEIFVSGTRYERNICFFFQVTGIRAALVSNGGYCSLAVNDTSTGKTIPGAAVSGTAYDRLGSGWNVDPEGDGSQKIAGKTDSDGIFSFSTGRTHCIISIISGSGDYLFFGRQNTSADTAHYVGYLYTDRQVYRPGDRINIWGYASPLPGEAQAQVMYLSVGGEAGKREITLSGDGTFSAFADIGDKRTGRIALVLSDSEGNTVIARSVTVSGSENPYPDYLMEITFDKPYFTKGQDITGTVSVSFFDGTPGVGIALDLQFLLESGSSRKTPEPVTVTTDGSGSAVFSISATSSFNTANIGYATVTAEISGIDIKNATVSGRVPFFYSDYWLLSYDPERRTTAFNTVALHLFCFDFEKIEEAGGYSSQDQIFRATGEYSVPVKYYIEKTWYEKTSVTRYDPYTGKTVTETDSYKRFAKGGEGEVTFIDGIALIPALELDDDDPATDITISWTFYDDSNGNTVTGSKSIRYSRTLPSESSSETSSYQTERLSFSESFAYLVPGEKYTIRLVMGDTPVQAPVFMCTPEGMTRLELKNGEVSFEFTEEMITGAWLTAVFYNTESGGYETASFQICYDFEREAAIDLEIDTDKASCSPGENAVISVRAKNGSRARVLLSVVDEACFALGDQKEESVGYLGWLINRKILQTQVVTRQAFSPGPMRLSVNRYDPVALAASVEGPSDSTFNIDASTGTNGIYVREYFADNPVFIEITLDENGNGTLSMRVPDNITRWRITALAVAGATEGVKDLHVGSAVSSVICTQEMFASLGIFPEYLERDDVTVSARAFGAAAVGTVNWRGEIKNAAGVTLSETSASSEGSVAAWLHFGKLAAGEYSVTVYAECGEARDALKKTVRVVEYAATVNAVTVTDIAGLANINPASYPVTVSFFNRNPSDIYDEIIGVLRRAGGERLDAIAARSVSVKAEKQTYGTDQNLTVPSDISAYIRYDAARKKQYPALFRYSDGSVKLLAELLASCPEILSGYDFSSALNKTLLSREQPDRTEFAATLAALAAYGEPVLGKIDEAAKELKEYPTEGKLFLALAYAVCGDNSSANRILAKVVTYIDEDGDGIAETVFVQGSDGTETAELTGLALLSASRTSRGTAEKMVKYLLSGGVSKLALPGLSAYLRYYLPSDLPEAAKIVYSIDGTEKTITLRAGQSQSVTLSKTEFESLTVKSYTGETGVRVFYPQSLEEAEKEAGNRKLTVQKKVDFKIGQSYNLTVTVTVSGWTDGEGGFYQINDFIPTGALFTCFPNNDRKKFNLSCSGRRITGGFYVAANTDENGEPVPTQFSVSFSYVIRGVLEGEYVAEPCVVFRSTDGATGFSGRSVYTFGSDGKFVRLMPYKE